ncbi:pyrimidine reductase family protein [Actinomycetospora soli]|uniref:pyrimidine reductase family protein n=1 Tax=Actinomycetospora soli TaxID=2893887 RepID=UPI001E545038|nr:pyrimidine reductase family protein [Actinomycetospora soli]MCD2188185.1 pyrimidine reductase family protein [Actinomycetospora soli]
MRHVWPPGGPDGELDRDALAALYAHPAPTGRPFVRVNFAASADGAVSVDGRSAGLDAPGDRTVFGLLRELADVIVAGSGTVRAEDYRGARTSEAMRARRRGRGQAAVPPVAVVTASPALDPGAALFTDTRVPPLIVTTTAAAPAAARRYGSVADVLDAGDLSPAAVLDALAARGLARVLCEGGPVLFGSFAAAGLVDELCLSVAPSLVGGGPGRILAGPGLPTPLPLRLAAALAHDDGLLLRYTFVRSGDNP